MSPRGRPVAPGRARRSLGLAAVLGLAGCGLLAPFDLGLLPASDADADADADLDGDDERDGEAADGDAVWDAEADGPPFDPLAGCTGEVAEERWAVVVEEGGRLRGYLTGRDCADPVPICHVAEAPDCLPVSISPSGEAVLVVRPAAGGWRLLDEIGLVRRGAGEPERLERDGGPVLGTSPAWADDDSFYYVAAAAGVDGPCAEATGALPELTDLRRHRLSTGEDEAVGERVRRASRGGFPVPSSADGPVALGRDDSPECDATSIAVFLRDPGGAPDRTLLWTAARRHYDFAVGLLPAAAGFLVQTVESTDGEGFSKLYAVAFDGAEARVVTDGLTTGRIHVVMGRITWYWPGCASAHRLGPACEVTCVQQRESRWWRHSLLGGEPEEVLCPTLAGAFWIMDVHQR